MNNNFFDERIFYIDSDNLNDIESKLYGFCISVNNDKISLLGNKNCIAGSFINIIKNTNDIYIQTDDFSSLYIFYYMKDDFFAISNSFYKLLNNLKDKGKRVTINKEYIEQYIQSPLHSHSLYNTLVNEILILPFGNDIKIFNNHIEFINKNIELQSISILSKEGIDIINNWINKWVNIVRPILNSDYHIQIDLSGGFDSRVIFSLLYYSGVNLNKDNINIYSKHIGNKGLLEHLSNDYEVATSICNKLNLEININSKSNNKSNYYSSEEQYIILKNTFLGLHKSGFTCLRECETPQFHFGGLNGEVIRGALPNLDTKTIKERLSRNPIRNNENVIKRFYLDLDELKSKSKTDFEALTKFFLSTQCRSHFGLSVYNSFIANIYSLVPFNDKELLKLYIPEGIDKNIVFAIMIYKTCPEIFDIDFMNNQKFSEETKQLAIELSERYKLIDVNYNYILTDINNLLKTRENKYCRENAFDEVYKIFVKDKDLFISKFSELFNKDYAEKLYQYADEYYTNKDNFTPNMWISCLTSIIEVFKILYNNPSQNS